ncbi:hypothetical protein BP5796_10226 [Coleophoma crateriformis]|uniref:Uncharacterized protein n=1 Tax=Coleophoma crateriformis TaxID=565419 RepID=A0A3D8QVJ1_9HELO|nr:hypothetical protein BP5796_10226 [Coleophoma crateriformis]
MSAPATTTRTQPWKTSTPPIEGTPCWHQIPAVDVQACKRFYSALFPSWQFIENPAKYPEEFIALFNYEGSRSMAGGIVKTSEEAKSQEQGEGVGMTVHYYVKSIEATQKRVVELGGTILTLKIPEADNGYFMLCKDVAGNRFSMYEEKTD